MTRNARIGKERHFSEITREVGAADAHAMGAHDGFIGSALSDVFASDEIDLGGSCELDG